jgi:hypothetical protein
MMMIPDEPVVTRLTSLPPLTEFSDEVFVAEMMMMIIIMMMVIIMIILV